MQVHRFRDAAGVCAGKGETVYLTSPDARLAGLALIAVADSIDREDFKDSRNLTVSIRESDIHSIGWIDRDEAGRALDVAALDILQPLGFREEMGGGGAVFLSRYSDESSRYIWATDSDGSGMPRPADFMLGLYSRDDDGAEPITSTRVGPGHCGAETLQDAAARFVALMDAPADDPAACPFDSFLQGLGFKLEEGGAAPAFYCYRGPAGAVVATSTDGGFPTESDWLFGVYLGDALDMGRDPSDSMCSDMSPEHFESIARRAIAAVQPAGVDCEHCGKRARGQARNAELCEHCGAILPEA